MKPFVMSLLILGTVFAAKAAVADDVVWVELAPLFRYQDAGTSCSNYSEITEPYYLVVRVDDASRVTQAEFRNSPSPLPMARTGFTARELAGIKLEKDQLGDYWIKELSLSARAINWVFNHLETRTCRPYMSLDSLSADQGVFTFTRKDKDTFFTPVRKYAGTRDGWEYEAHLAFIQKIMGNP